MIFSVIYQVDTKQGGRPYVPPPGSGLWRCTESKGGRKKFCAVLRRDQFETFLQQSHLYPIEGAGTVLGSPASPLGFAPCITFDNDQNAEASVTPLPEVFNRAQFNRRDWSRVETAVRSQYY